MKLFEFRDKKVKIIDIDGQELIGIVTDYDSANNNDEGRSGISVDTGLPGIVTFFFENEIESIEIVN